MRGIQTTVCGGVLGLMATAGLAQFSFSGADYPTPPEPKGLATGDFDGDGDIDVATTTPDQATILFNDGKGAFGGAFNYDAGGAGAAHLIGALLDGDDDVDLALVLADSNQVRIMRNTGNGTFVQGALVNVGALPTWMIGFDADGDDDIDLGVVNTGAGSVTILFNDGNAGYGVSETFPVGDDPRALAAGDFDGDGDMDLAASRRSNRTIEVHSNDGKGHFTFHQSVLVGGQVEPESLVAADLNGDDEVDLAATASLEGGPNLVAVLINSEGMFGTPVHYPTAGVDPGAIVASDFNGDGNLDLANVNRGSASVTLLRGMGDGTFGKAKVVAVGDNPRRLRAADLNGDDKMDIVTSNRDENSITALINTGAQGGCQADMDGNGELELFDFLTFQNKFNAQDPAADCDTNGQFNLFDFLCFQNLFNKGCP